MTPAVQRQVVAKYESLLPLLLPRNVPKEKGCFYHAWAMLMAVRSLGFAAVPQAGGASYLAVPDELDDGVSPTHYSYVYEGWKRSFIDSEIHCWVVAKWMNSYIIIDPTVRYVPSLSEQAGVKWQADVPPECLFAPINNLPYGWEYRPHPEATAEVINLIHSM